MPIYEYIRKKCGKRNSFLIYPWENEILKCKFCGSEELQRIISRFARLRSDEERIERTVESAMSSVDINNPESIKEWMRKTLKEYSDELGGEVDIDEAVESLSEELGMGKRKGEESETEESEEGSSYDFGESAQENTEKTGESV